MAVCSLCPNIIDGDTRYASRAESGWICHQCKAQERLIKILDSIIDDMDSSPEQVSDVQ